jgi:hypothetical protein
MTTTATTVYTEDVLKRFVRFDLTRRRGRLIGLGILELGLLWIVVNNIRVAGVDGSFATIEALLLPFVLPALVLFMYTFANRANRRIIDAVNHYVVSDYEIVIDSTIPTVIGQMRAGYGYFERIYETKDVFYLYASAATAFILQKSDITQGSVVDLQNSLRKSVPPDKYSVRD